MMNKLPGKIQDMKGLETQAISQSPVFDDPMIKVILTADDCGNVNPKRYRYTYIHRLTKRCEYCKMFYQLLVDINRGV